MSEQLAVAAEEKPITLRPEGVFDIPAALRMRDALQLLPRATPVTLDFSALRECHDFALAALLQAVATQGGPVLLTRGLRQHQHRLLRYLGVGEERRSSTDDRD